MQRMLAITILLALLVAAVPARAATGEASMGDEAQAANALCAAKRIHSTTIEPGETFSFNARVGARTEANGFSAAGEGAEVGYGCAAAATALYQALRELPSGAVSFDELSYASDGSGLLVDDAGHDFRFTNLSAGALRIAFGASGNSLVCTATLDEAEASSVAAAGKAPPNPEHSDTVTLNCGDDPAVLTNVALAAGSVYNTTLASGDVFSFNGSVGPTVAECGYVPATDGRGATVVGGGACQVASALWLLIQNRSDVVIVEKATYGSGYCQSYVSSASDAILTDYASDTDFSFRYTGEGSITLYAVVDGSSLICVIE